MKKSLILACILCLCLVLPLAGAQSNEEYALFAIKYNESMVQSEALGMTSAIAMTADGHGFMSLDDETMDISQWTLEGETFSIILADGGTAGGILHNGILELDLYGNGEMILYYALPDADRSAYPAMTYDEFMAQYATDQAASIPDSRLYALSQGMDIQAGVHMVYSVHHDYMNADQDYDVQGRGGMYYSLRTTQVAGKQNAAAVLFRDGTAYNLSPESATGLKVTSTSMQSVNEDALLMDTLYRAIRNNADRTDFIRENREISGIAYDVEVFPAPDEYQSDFAFYFDGDGRLVYCEETHSTSSSIQMGISFYLIHIIDGNLNDALFELTGYTITE